MKVQYNSAWGGNGAAENVASLAEFKAYTSSGTVVPPPLPADPPKIIVPQGAPVITDGSLRVTVHPDFPQVVQYQLGHATLAGKFGQALKSVLINGKETSVQVGKPVVSRAGSTVTYPLTTQGKLQVSFSAVISVQGQTLTYKITDIQDKARVLNYLEIPNLDLLSITDEGKAAGFYDANMSVNRAISGDRLTDLKTLNVSGTPLDRTAWMLTAWTDQLAAGFHSNAVVDRTVQKPGKPDTSLKYRLEKVGGVKVGAVSPAEWVYRGGSVQYYDRGNGIGPDQDPFVRIKFTADANNDQVVDWQDGAIALRDIRPAARQSADVNKYVITRIPFNIVSQAVHPFLRTLDDTKRIALATDNLGQQVLLKGYQAEGHDSAQGDYAGHYNEKAGGLKDLKTLVAEGKNWNATFGIHVNATESYSEAKAFNETLLRMPPQKAWGWMNQAYTMDNFRDLGEGNVLRRLAELRRDFPQDSNLNWLYWDVYYPRGWEANRFAQEVTKQGWRLGSEWASAMPENNTWSHWANDEKYGGQENKGINSKLARFVMNTTQDVFNPDPMLGNTNVVEFEGWSGHNDYNAFIKNVWQRNLPTKFLQQSEIMKWDSKQITFKNGTTVQSDLSQIAGDVVPTQRTITFDGAQVYKNGGSYLLPWEDGGRKRLYYWNPGNKPQDWTLTKAWAGQQSLKMFRLTDTGRVWVDDVRVVKGKISLPATNTDTAYVLYPVSQVPQAINPQWGFGSAFQDPGFFSGNTKAYTTKGEVKIVKSPRANFQAQLGPSTSSLAQNLQVTAGDYSAWAWVEIEPGQTRNVTVSVNGKGIRGLGGKDGVVKTTITASSAPNATASDEKLGTYFQRVPVRFHTDGHPFTFQVEAAAGKAKVSVDDLRIVPQAVPRDPQPTAQTVYFNDFENQDDGYWPFVTGSAKDGDARTQLAELHAPYSQSGWYGLVRQKDTHATEGQKYLDNVLDGKWSLMAHQENNGLILRTANASFPVIKGHKYRVSFQYQAAYNQDYSFVVGYDSAENGSWTQKYTDNTPITAARGKGWKSQGALGIGTQSFVKEFACTSNNPVFFGVVKNGNQVQGDLIIDNLRIEDLNMKPNPHPGGRPGTNPGSTPTPNPGTTPGYSGGYDGSYLGGVAAGSSPSTPPVAGVTENAEKQRIFGTNRVGTSLAALKQGDWADTALLAVATNFADAMTGATLSKPLQAPVVLTGGKKLEPEVLTALQARGFKKVIILGQRQAISQTVEKALVDAGLQVERLGGQSRFETAKLIAQKVSGLPGFNTQAPIFVADGLNFPDAIAIGNVAAQRGSTLVLSKGAELEQFSQQYLSDNKTRSRIAVGGPAARALNKAHFESQALIGKDRYETAALAAGLLPESKKAVIISGETFADSLAGGALAANQKAFVVLSRKAILPKVSEDLLKQRSHKVWVLGGPSAISAQVLSRAFILGTK